MKLKKDWTLAHFIYYICWIGYGLTLIYITLSAIMEIAGFYGDQTWIIDLPVTMEIPQLAELKNLEMENTSIFIPNYLDVKLNILTNWSENTISILLLHLIRYMILMVIAAVLFCFGRLFKNIAEQDPFNSSNPRYLYTAGWVVFVYGGINMILRLLPVPLLSELSLPEGYHFRHLDLPGDILLFTGIAFIVLGYVFKEGNRIHEEVKLTI